MGRVEIENSVIGADGLVLRGRIFFHRDAAREPGSGLGFTRAGRGPRNRRGGHDFLSLGEIHEELAGNWLEQNAVVTEGDSVFLRGPSARFEQGLFHARRLLAHRIQRFADHRRAHIHGAEIANFFDFEQIGK